MKINYIGIVAGIMAFISLALPWWTMTMSAEVMGVKASVDVSIYTYEARMTMEANGLKESESAPLDVWYADAALALIVIAGVVGIVGSLIVGKNGKAILVVAGVLALLSIIIFAVGLQGELSDLTEAGLPEVGLFSSGTWSYMGVSMDYSTYLSFGFWLALIATILAFISLLKHPMVPLARAKPMRTCLGCGMQIPVDYAVCPHCGKKAEKAEKA